MKPPIVPTLDMPALEVDKSVGGSEKDPLVAHKGEVSSTHSWVTLAKIHEDIVKNVIVSTVFWKLMITIIEGNQTSACNSPTEYLLRKKGEEVRKKEKEEA